MTSHNIIASLTVSASTDNLSRVRDYVHKYAREVGLSEFDSYNVALAVDEACANLIQHAYHNNSSGTIGVEIAIGPHVFRVSITDNSAPFDPSSAPLPDMRRYFLERRHHGLGILLMTRVMDSVEYHPASGANTQNTLVLTKRR